MTDAAMLFPPTPQEAACAALAQHAERIAKTACAAARESCECALGHEGECAECPMQYMWIVRDAVAAVVRGEKP